MLQRKGKLTVIATVMVVSLSFTWGVYAASDIRLFVNQQQLNAPMEIVDGNSYVPLRVVSEALGAEVNWNEETRSINITKLDRPRSHTTDLMQPRGHGESYFPVHIQVNNGPMVLDIFGITLDPAYPTGHNQESIKAIILSATMENTSNNEAIWHAVSGQMLLNTREYIQTGSPILSNEVDGRFRPKQKKLGDMVFEVKGDLNRITSLTYILNSPLVIKTDYPLEEGTEEAIQIKLKR